MDLCSGRSQTLPLSFSFFFFVLFLIRGRKRTKKKRAARRGAGFSVNHLNGNNGNTLPCHRNSPSRTMLLDVFARKNPQPHHSTLDGASQKTVRGCSCAMKRLQTPQHRHQPTPFPLPGGRGNRDPLAVSWFCSPSPRGRGGRGERSAFRLCLPRDGADVNGLGL